MCICVQAPSSFSVFLILKECNKHWFAARPCNLSDYILDVLAGNPALEVLLILPHGSDSDSIATALASKLPRLTGPHKGIIKENLKQNANYLVQ